MRSDVIWPESQARIETPSSARSRPLPVDRRAHRYTLNCEEPVHDAAARRRTLRQILLPIDPGDPVSKLGERWRDAPIVAGLGSRQLVDVVADVTAWLAVASQHDLPESGGGGIGAAAARDRQLHGVTGPPIGVPVPASDLHAWAADENIPDIQEWTLALMALNWSEVSLRWPVVGVRPYEPTLALLTPFRRGIGPELARNVYAPRRLLDENSDLERYGLRPEWLVQLRAGHVDRVHESVLQRLRQVGRVAPGYVLINRDPDQGRRIAAALLPQCVDWRKPFVRTSRALREDLDVLAGESDDAPNTHNDIDTEETA